MVYTLSYQMYKCQHGLAAAEQRAADARAGEAARAVRDLRLGLGRVRGAAGAVSRSGVASLRLLSSGR